MMNRKKLSQFETLLCAALVFAAPQALAQVEAWHYNNPNGAPQAPPAQPQQGLPQTVDPSLANPPQNQPPAASAQQDPALQNLIQMLNGGLPGGIAIGEGGDKSGYGHISQQIGSGEMEACGEPPPSARGAFEIAKNFREKCSLAHRGENQKIAVNDYSSVRMPMMYIFDLQGKCLGKTAVAYGNGVGPTRPMPCGDTGSHLTPPGFHLTSVHNGALYNSSNSLGLVGLEGQNSKARGVIIHKSRAPGAASTWGCSGVGNQAFYAVKKSLGEGSLVYNYFGNTPAPAHCRNRNGLSPAHNFCRLDPGAPSLPGISTSQGAPATR